MEQSRDRINNPNYPPSTSTSSSHPSPAYPSHQTSAPQPPPQQPPFDPFTRPELRRDPFMPASFGSRRDSLNSNSGLSQNNYSSRDGHQPTPQPPPSPFRSGHSASYSSDRRNSLGGSLDSGPPQSSLQHPSSLLTRHMPPPSSSPKQSPSQSYSASSMRGRLPSPVQRPRDVAAAPNSNHRSGGNMSIQSIMGSDTGPSSNPPSWSNPPARTSSASYTQPPSPLDRRFGPKVDSETEPRPHTPIRRPDGPTYAPFERRETSVTSPSAATTGHYQPPDRGGGHGFSSLLQPFNGSNESNGVPSRPYSQPTGIDPAAGHPGPVHYDSRQGSGSRDDYGGGTFEKAVRDRSFSDLDGKKGSLLNHEYPRPSHEPFSPTSGPPQPVHAPYQPRAQEYRDPLLNGGGARRDPEPIQTTSHRRPELSLNESSQPYPNRLSTLNGGSDRQSFDREMPNSREQSGPPNMSYYPGLHADGARRYDPQSSRTPPIDAQLRKSIEDSNRQSFSRFASDFGRRPDRSSPLPQAVQGAQSQPAGSGRDPGIKSEFGRMFSGLGSGVGSTPQPVPPLSNGAPTPNRRSPEDDVGELEPFVRRNLHESSGQRATGVGSRGGRRGGKRQLAENGRRDSDSGDGRVTPATTSVRGAKRNRYMQPSTGHHHHHHPHGPHHHHHHRKADENVAFPLTRRPSNTPYGTAFRFPTPGPTPNNSNVPHHHHHHHHAGPTPVPHHHHLPPKQVPEARVKRPTTTISTSPLLRGVSHLQRRHLGSQLYAPTLSVPGASFGTVDSPSTHQTTTDPNPLPHFDRSRVNCTFSIRVPRYYLSESEREKICKARRVWGTDVYTDDSDPLAAAFHAGWIRGAWAGDVDLSIVLGIDSTINGASGNNPKPNGNPEPTSSPERRRDIKPDDSDNGNTTNPELRTLTAPPPSGPLPPPPNRDLHLTLLLLPPLEKYTGSVWHGVRSRSWGGNHDGLSFKIEKVEWVDEGLGSRWEERSIEAKKKRLGTADKDTSSQQPLTNGSKKRPLEMLDPSPVVGTMRASRIAQMAV